jgi:hypothetical protein
MNCVTSENEVGDDEDNRDDDDDVADIIGVDVCGDGDDVDVDAAVDSVEDKDLVGN